MGNYCRRRNCQAIHEEVAEARYFYENEFNPSDFEEWMSTDILKESLPEITDFLKKSDHSREPSCFLDIEDILKRTLAGTASTTPRLLSHQEDNDSEVSDRTEENKEAEEEQRLRSLAIPLVHRELYYMDEYKELSYLIERYLSKLPQGCKSQRVQSQSHDSTSEDSLLDVRDITDRNNTFLLNNNSFSENSDKEILKGVGQNEDGSSETDREEPVVENLKYWFSDPTQDPGIEACQNFRFPFLSEEIFRSDRKISGQPGFAVKEAKEGERGDKYLYIIEGLMFEKPELPPGGLPTENLAKEAVEAQQRNQAGPGSQKVAEEPPGDAARAKESQEERDEEEEQSEEEQFVSDALIYKEVSKGSKLLAAENPFDILREGTRKLQEAKAAGKKKKKKKAHEIVVVEPEEGVSIFGKKAGAKKKKKAKARTEEEVGMEEQKGNSPPQFDEVSLIAEKSHQHSDQEDGKLVDLLVDNMKKPAKKAQLEQPEVKPEVDKIEKKGGKNKNKQQNNDLIKGQETRIAVVAPEDACDVLVDNFRHCFEAEAPMIELLLSALDTMVDKCPDEVFLDLNSQYNKYIFLSDLWKGNKK
jgi:hypothetical protein